MENLEVPKKPIALIVSKGITNPGLYSRFLLNRYLFTHKQFRFSGVPSVEKFPDLFLEKIAVIILFFHSDTISQDALNSLDHYIREGGGLIAFLPALTSFSDSPVYSEIIGASGTVSDQVERMTITSVPNQDTIFDPCPDFGVSEKRPVMRLHLTSEVHYSIKNGDTAFPYIWTRTYDRGRICGIAAGGAPSSFQNPSLQKLISQSLNWCSRNSTELSLRNDQ